MLFRSLFSVLHHFCPLFSLLLLSCLGDLLQYTVLVSFSFSLVSVCFLDVSLGVLVTVF